MIVGGGLAALVAAGFLAAGGLVLWTDAAKTDADSYITSSQHRFQTVTSALASDGLDVDVDGDWAIDGAGSLLKFRVTGTSDKPLFIGIAPKTEVDAYLRDVTYDEVSDVTADPFAIQTVRHDGSAAPAPPASQGIWQASVVGDGAQTLSWDVQPGDWSVVVMNADGSPGVDAELAFGVRIPFLLWIGIGCAIAGAILLAGGAALLYHGGKTPRRRREVGGPAPAAS